MSEPKWKILGLPEPKGYPHSDWPQSVYLESAMKRIAELENTELVNNQTINTLRRQRTELEEKLEALEAAASKSLGEPDANGMYPYVAQNELAALLKGGE